MIVASGTALIVAGAVAPAAGRDRPFSTSNLILSRMLPAPEQYSDLAGRGITSIDGTFSTTQIERFTCPSSGDPSKGAVDISCNTTHYGQDFAPDNEIAIAMYAQVPKD